MKDHYQSLFKQYGDSAKAVQWSDEASQYARFKILTGIDAQLNSVIDVGCGLGELFNYLKTHCDFKGNYLGLDFVPEFIEAAKSKFRNDQNAKFSEFDLLQQTLPKDFDYILLSGVFNNKMEDNKNFMLDSIAKMFEACKKGIAFNAMSTYVDFQADNLYYSDPLEIFDFCKKNLTKKITLRHDYLVKENSIPFEYTMYLYR